MKEKGSGVGFLQFDMNNRHPISIKILVVDNKLLGFNLQVQFYAIKKLGGVCVTSDGIVSFPQFDWPLHAAITINKPNFYTEYD